MAGTSFLIFVGSFTPLISTLKLDLAVRPPKLSLVTQTEAGTSPSWIQGNPANPAVLYSTDEVENGALNSFSIDFDTGVLSLVDTIATQGAGPTHIGVGQDGTELTAANFGGGSAFFVGLNDDLLTFKTPGQLISFDDTGVSRAHQAVEVGNEIFIPDLGLDTVHRISRGVTGFVNAGEIPQRAGSGPRHIAVNGTNLFTLHELDNRLTEQTFASIDLDAGIRNIASLSIIPAGTNADAALAAGELLFADNLLYASNRNDLDADGDAIAIFETEPRLRLRAQFRTGLQHLRAVAFGGPNNEFIVAGGLNGGGIKVFERVSEAQGFLREVAALPQGVVDQPTAFVVVSPSAVIGTGTASVLQTPSSSGPVRTTSYTSGARRRRSFFWQFWV